MGSGRGRIGTEAIKRAGRTIFFMVIMISSFLVSSAPLLVSITDILAPCLLLSLFACCTSCFKLSHDWMASYSFRTSLIDIPLMSLIRSMAILCVYSICGIPRLTYGPYVSTTAICAALSALILGLKAIIWTDHHLGMFHMNPRASLDVFNHMNPTTPDIVRMPHAWGIYSLFSCSMVLALSHMMVAYKVKCQAQKKMHLYKLDPEAVIGLKTFLYASIRESKHSVSSARWEEEKEDFDVQFVSNHVKL